MAPTTYPRVVGPIRDWESDSRVWEQPDVAERKGAIMKTLVKLVLVGLAARWVIGKIRERPAPAVLPADSSSP
jgi:hypothetical protein